MTRRASLPGAAELFRRTGAPGDTAPAPTAESATREVPEGSSQRADGARRGSGRQKHDTKITVYVSDEELLGLEQTRLGLRASYGLGVDRGRIVREAIAVLLADFEEQAEDSVLVRRLRQEPAQ